MAIPPMEASQGPISTRNGVPPAASDPPGGVPRKPDPDVRPHEAPTPADPETGPDLPENEPPREPPHREARDDNHKRSHHRSK